ncbi:MAG: slipin family protein [Bacteroidota bacterium]
MRTRINTGRIGLVFKAGEYKRVLTAGGYWTSPFEQVMVYDMSKPFHPSVELNILLKDEKLSAMLHIVEVADTEIVLQYEDGNFKAVLQPGRYTFWKGLIDYQFIKIDLSKIEITEDLDPGLLQRKELHQYLRVFAVENYEQGLMFIDGKFHSKLEAGLHYFWVNPIPVAVLKADMRQQQMEISGQEMLTRDKAALRLNFYAQYTVMDVEKALIDNKDYAKQLYIQIQLALREFIGTLTLDELLERKEAIADYVAEALKDKALSLGVAIGGCGVRDIILPGEMKEIMNQVLIAQKQAQANVIMRREETASTRSLLNTAKLMEENDMLFKLKEMEYVEKIADKINSISLSGGNQVVDQLKEIFTPSK